MGSFIELFQKAYQFMKAGQLEEAITFLEESEKAYSDSDGNENISLEDLYILKGSVYLHLDKLDDSRKTFEQALQQNPYSSEACLGLGKLLYIGGDTDGAKVMMEWAVKNDPNNEAAKINLSQINTLLNLPEDHSKLDGAEIPEEKADINDPLSEAFQLFENKEYQQALDFLDDIKNEYNQKLASIENFKGFNFLALQDAESATNAFEKALELNPESSQAYAGLAEIHYLREEDDVAKKLYVQAIKNNPNNEFAKAGLKKVESKLEKFENKDNKHALLEDTIQVAYALFAEKEYSHSLQKLEQCENLAIELNLDNKDMLTSLRNFKGFNLLGLNELELAKKAFESALEINPNSSQACAGLGEMYYLLELDDQSKAMYEWGVKNNPSNQFAISGLAKINKLLGKPEDHSSLDEENVGDL